VTVLGSVLIHIVLFRFVLRVFFRAMYRGVGNHTSNGHGVPDVVSELDRFALDLPSAAFGGGEVVLAGVVTFDEATRDCCLLRFDAAL
jgi:hypothetical protein